MVEEWRSATADHGDVQVQLNDDERDAEPVPTAGGTGTAAATVPDGRHRSERSRWQSAPAAGRSDGHIWRGKSGPLDVNLNSTNVAFCISPGWPNHLPVEGHITDGQWSRAKKTVARTERYRTETDRRYGRPEERTEPVVVFEKYCRTAGLLPARA